LAIAQNPQENVAERGEVLPSNVIEGDVVMAFNFVELDAAVRAEMMNEVNRDITSGVLYISSRLNEEGVRRWPALLQQAVSSHDEVWLAEQLRRYGLLAASAKKSTSQALAYPRISDPGARSPP